MLVVDARDSGRGRLLVVEADVLDRCLIGPGPMLSQVALTSDRNLADDERRRVNLFMEVAGGGGRRRDVRPRAWRLRRPRIILQPDLNVQKWREQPTRDCVPLNDFVVLSTFWGRF